MNQGALLPRNGNDPLGRQFFTEKLENALFVWGMVTYDDGFGNRRYTKFCHRYYTKPFYGAGTFELQPDAGQVDEDGNDAD